MANVSPDNFVLKCYGYKTKEGKWFGLCLDFNLAVEGISPEELRHKMGDVIKSYVDAVWDSEDKPSIPELFSRRAPLYDWLIYYAIRLAIYIRQFPNNFTFKEIVPFHLAHSC